jgi:predicted RNase H-like HicB family nuclease
MIITNKVFVNHLHCLIKKVLKRLSLPRVPADISCCCDQRSPRHPRRWWIDPACEEGIGERRDWFSTFQIRKELEGYVARCSKLGVVSAGDSAFDALVNTKEGAELYLENMVLTARWIPIKPSLQVFS